MFARALYLAINEEAFVVVDATLFLCPIAVCPRLLDYDALFWSPSYAVCYGENTKLLVCLNSEGIRLFFVKLDCSFRVGGGPLFVFEPFTAGEVTPAMDEGDN
jgi:hypothetical protein